MGHFTAFSANVSPIPMLMCGLQRARACSRSPSMCFASCCALRVGTQGAHIALLDPSPPVRRCSPNYFLGMWSGAGIEIGATVATSASALRRCLARLRCSACMWRGDASAFFAMRLCFGAGAF